MSDPSLTQPIFATDGPDLPVLPERRPLTTGRFLRALLVACVLYFVLLIAFASLGMGTLALFASVVPAVGATAKLTETHGIAVLAAIGILAFFIVNVTAYVLLIALLSGYTGPVGG
jgi:hypothetical protein